jgi:ABC-2 type transport system ATP-binding protein
MVGRMPDLAIEALDLVRTYHTHTGVVRRRPIDVEAVRGISFEVRPGELFGLLGPNGAGKTTTIKMLVTLLLPTSGTARVMGLDVVRDTTEVRKRIGYVFGGEGGLYDRISGLDNLRFFAELYGVEPDAQRPRIDALLEMVGLAGREKEKVEGYSRGMRQRLHIARGLLHDPPVLFLDEPSLGLDPVGARELRRTIADLVAGGKTVLLTTHYMFEADALCDRIAVINGGRIVASGSGSDLKGAIAERTIVEIETFGVTDEALGRLRADPDVIAVNTEDADQSQILLVQSERGTEITQRLIQHLGDTRIGKISAREPTLEDAYVHLIATTCGEDGNGAERAAGVA